MWESQRDQIVVSLGSEGESDILVLPVPAREVDSALSLGGKVIGPRGLSERGNEGEVVYVQYEEKSGDSLRRMVRDRYGNGKWTQFFSLAEIISQGGSMSLDDKLFIFTRADEKLEILRFENGVCVEEFREIRANPRCLLEFQFLRLKSIADASYDEDRQTQIKRILLVGEHATQPIISALFTNIFDLPVYTVFPPFLPTAHFSDSAQTCLSVPSDDKSPYLMYRSMLREHIRLK
ncbi:hypothetical protein I302_103858 [Kwoniella bestiolae CBS 10118]|uniref:Uncharacterized protein n=1 Tax=Kwoniella bestiolae CBS 10118 TaxID=1296100 RepID=A0A1B9G9M3_9TREE|nr:hypothetical protein I302_02561 [Kwoniella bestiolae CBS 10118]OCF27716.1 hypothetical protein I302_02561 [Kwoniella bestiolae CBS 10118]